jgi:uncharacterized protein (TIGR02217 family)
MSFHEVQFPPKIAYGASGGPGFSTSIALSFNGFEQRNINWHTAKGKWDISTGIKSSSDIDKVLSFFRARFGKAYGFRFKDWSDYKVIGQVIGVGDNKTRHFQLIKDYKSGNYHYTRDILKPVEGSIRVYIDSKATDTTHPYTVNTTNGIITFEIAPEDGVIISSDFEFDVPARFDIDQIVVRASGPNQFVADSVNIVEIKQQRDKINKQHSEEPIDQNLTTVKTTKNESRPL